MSEAKSHALKWFSVNMLVIEIVKTKTVQNKVVYLRGFLELSKTSMIKEKYAFFIMKCIEDKFEKIFDVSNYEFGRPLLMG